MSGMRATRFAFVLLLLAPQLPAGVLPEERADVL